MRKICSTYLGEISYTQGLEYQKKARALVNAGAWEGIILMLQHKPVYTIGRRGGEEHLLVSQAWLGENEVELFDVDRGGDITCHSPGQLVVYPIINLNCWKRDVHWYVHQLEESIIQTLRQWHITAGRKAAYTGVWVGNEKIAAIGVGVKRWITYHGIALNICNDLSLFSHIISCGIKEFGVTRLKNQGIELSVEEVMPVLEKEIMTILDIEEFESRIDWSDVYERSLGEAEVAGTTCQA